MGSKDQNVTAWADRAERPADAKREYEAVMTTPGPDTSYTYYDAGAIGFVIGERSRVERAVAAVGRLRAQVPRFPEGRHHRSPWSLRFQCPPSKPDMNFSLIRLSPGQSTAGISRCQRVGRRPKEALTRKNLTATGGGG